MTIFPSTYRPNGCQSRPDRYDTDAREAKQEPQRPSWTQAHVSMPYTIRRRADPRGADILMVYDPRKPAESLSEAQRQACNEWYDHTLYSWLSASRSPMAAAPEKPQLTPRGWPDSPTKMSSPP